jgi:hypothetical protein
METENQIITKDEAPSTTNIDAIPHREQHPKHPRKKDP